MTLRELSFQIASTMIAIVGVGIIFMAFLAAILAFFDKQPEDAMPAPTDEEEAFNQFYYHLCQEGRCDFTQDEALRLYGVWQRETVTS